MFVVLTTTLYSVMLALSRKRFDEGVPANMDNYSDFFMSRKQAQAVAFSIIDCVQEYVNQHQTEFEEFLRNEELKERGDKNAKTAISNTTLKNHCNPN